MTSVHTVETDFALRDETSTFSTTWLRTVPKFLPVMVTMPPPGWAVLKPVIAGHEAPPQAAHVCRRTVLMDWDNSFIVAVADSLQRDEFGAIGRLSNTGIGTEKDGVTPGPALPIRGIAAATGSNPETETKIGRATSLARGMPPSWRVQVTACISRPEASWVVMQGMEPLTLIFARSSPLMFAEVRRLAYNPMSDAEKRLLKIGPVKPNAAVQVAEGTVTVELAVPPVGHELSDVAQTLNTTGPVASVMLDSR